VAHTSGRSDYWLHDNVAATACSLRGALPESLAVCAAVCGVLSIVGAVVDALGRLMLCVDVAPWLCAGTVTVCPEPLFSVV
jgi:hypothetical protein